MPKKIEKPPIEDIVAGDTFRNSLVERADAWDGPAPLWHGWALMDAFLAGIEYAKSKTPPPLAHRRWKMAKQKYVFHVAETRHFEFEIWADDDEKARDYGREIWREATVTGHWELPDTETEYEARKVLDR